MPSAEPPPVHKPSRAKMGRGIKLLIGLGVIPGFCYAALIVLRLFGLIRPFYIPTGGMAPAISVGDHVLMENVTFHFREPHRGDIVVFRTDGILPVAPAHYVKRVAGEPGDHLQISAGNLFINGQQVTLSNDVGKISYDFPSWMVAQALQTNVIVPRGCYYVTGDNSLNSEDSRFFGSVPRTNIIGRILFCYWPADRAGAVK